MFLKDRKRKTQPHHKNTANLRGKSSWEPGWVQIFKSNMFNFCGGLTGRGWLPIVQEEGHNSSLSDNKTWTAKLKRHRKHWETNWVNHEILLSDLSEAYMNGGDPMVPLGEKSFCINAASLQQIDQ